MLIFVVGRTRLDRYEELRLHFEDWRDVEPHDPFAGVVERRRAERRHRLDDQPHLKLGWSVVDTEELASRTP